MATVFLSYDHDDVERAAPIASALEKSGHSVWWDRHIQGGAQYNDEIEAAVEGSDALVVLWSERSIRSTWVRDEAAEGRDQGKLVPVLLDAVKPPMGFRQFQTIDLSRSPRGPSSDVLQQILDAIDRVGGTPRTSAPTAVARPSWRLGQIGRPAIVAVAVALLLMAAGFVGWNWYGRQSLPVVTIAASSSSARSQELARDLFVKLGTLSHVGASKWRLADQSAAPSDPDLVFRVSENRSASGLTASLTLLDRRQDSLVWSGEFAHPPDAEADLRQRVSMAAGLALLCALEAREDGGLTLDLARRYLASCAEAAVQSNAEPDKTVAAMRSIISERPRFTPAWTELLGAQANVVALAQIVGVPDPADARRSLRQDIERARAIAPDLPIIALVETELLSPMDYAGKLARAARAKAQAPDKGDIWGFETMLLMSVGRMYEAVQSAKRAADLEPLVPPRDLVLTLAYSGRIDAAKAELARAERIWAGTAALQDMQWAFHLRFGDPKIAVAARAQGDNLYLQTRLDPTPANINALVAETKYVPEPIGDQLGYAIQALAEFGKTDEVYVWLERVPPSRLATFSYLLFRPAFDDVRRDRRFMVVAKRIGLVRYWRKSGIWPDYCYDPKLPYDCRKEAAKLAA